MQTISQRIVRDGLIYGVGVGKVSWDATADDGLGNVSISRISPLNFFPEPQATSVENANYIFVRRRLSKFDLINQYKGNKRVLEILDKLDQKPDQEVRRVMILISYKVMKTPRMLVRHILTAEASFLHLQKQIMLCMNAT